MQQNPQLSTLPADHRRSCLNAGYGEQMTRRNAPLCGPDNTCLSATARVKIMAHVWERCWYFVMGGGFGGGGGRGVGATGVKPSLFETGLTPLLRCWLCVWGPGIFWPFPHVRLRGARDFLANSWDLSCPCLSGSRRFTCASAEKSRFMWWEHLPACRWIDRCFVFSFISSCFYIILMLAEQTWLTSWGKINLHCINYNFTPDLIYWYPGLLIISIQLTCTQILLHGSKIII